MASSTQLRSISVQVTDALGRPVSGAILEVHVGGKRRVTHRKTKESPTTFKFPSDLAASIIVTVPGHPPQTRNIGTSASECNFEFKGAGTPVVLIVCAKDCEQAAVFATCDSYTEPIGRKHDSNIYREGFYRKRPESAPRKVLIVTSGMGNLNADAVTMQALMSFPDLEHILMVGIAGGCPNHLKPAEHVRLGDVVVPDHRGIFKYDDVKRTEQGDIPRSAPQPVSARMLQAATQLDSEAAIGKRPWEQWIQKGIEAYRLAVRPDPKSDELHIGSVVVEHPVDGRLPGQPRVQRGAIASADTLQKDPSIRDKLRDQYAVRAIEMEGSGVQNAGWMQNKDVIVIRGICDYCDRYKNDIWQPYASVVAAAYARSMIEILPEEWFP